MKKSLRVLPYFGGLCFSCIEGDFWSSFLILQSAARYGAWGGGDQQYAQQQYAAPQQQYGINQPTMEEQQNYAQLS